MRWNTSEKLFAYCWPLYAGSMELTDNNGDHLLCIVQLLIDYLAEYVQLNIKVDHVRLNISS